MKSVIVARGKPIQLLCYISAGRRIKVGSQDGKSTEFVWPTLEQR